MMIFHQKEGICLGIYAQPRAVIMTMLYSFSRLKCNFSTIETCDGVAEASKALVAIRLPYGACSEGITSVTADTMYWGQNFGALGEC
jgi:hypothetical protein